MIGYFYLNYPVLARSALCVAANQLHTHFARYCLNDISIFHIGLYFLIQLSARNFKANVV